MLKAFSGVQPRILWVTPEVTFIPDGRELTRGDMIAHGQGFANDLVSLIFGLYDLGVDVHVAQPDYRQIFKTFLQEKRNKKARKLPAERVHLTEDRAFFYSRYPDCNYKSENIRISIAFQREVINQIISRVQPDLIHCHDWMTGLIPSMAKEMDIPCLFTVRKSHSAKSCLSYIEDMGIDAAAFWQYLFFDNFPSSYEQTRDSNPADFLLSGVFAASFVDTATPACPMDMFADHTHFFEVSLMRLLAQKWKAGYAFNLNQPASAKIYIDAYERMLQRPIIHINPQPSLSPFVKTRVAA
jgi:starch synthase/alpha-amylase